MKQRILSLLLAICMLTAVVPTTAIEAQAATPTIQGKIIDTMNRPVPATVSLYRDGESSPLATTSANESTGEFVLSRSGGFEDGTYTIKAEYPICVTTTMTISLSSGDGFVIATPITMKLVGRASGTVTNATTGAGISGVTVSVYTTGGSLATSTITDAGGKYKVETEQGSYNIEFSRNGYTTGRLEDVTLGVIETTHDVQLIPGKIIDSGKCGDNITWKLSSIGSLIITGEGEMYIYSNAVSIGPWVPWYRDNRVELAIIGSGITKIGRGTFFDNSNLRAIVIPKSVKSISSISIRGCKITDVYYAGAESEWNQIAIAGYGKDVEGFRNSTIHFNSTGPTEIPTPNPTSPTTGTPSPKPTSSPDISISPHPTSDPTPSSKPTPVNNTKFQSLASDWETAYTSYTEAIRKKLSSSAQVNLKAGSLKQLAEKFEASLGKEYGLQVATIGLTKDDRVLVYKALLKMMSEYVGSEMLAFGDISTSDLDKLPTKIVNKVANALKNTSYQYVEGNTKVNIELMDYSGAKWGSATIVKPSMFYPKTTAFSSSPSAVQSILKDYTRELLDLEGALAAQAAQEVYKELLKTLFGKSIDSLTSNYINNKVSKFTPQLKKMGLGNVSNSLNNCYNYYKFIKKIKDGDTSDLLSMLDGTKDISFSDPSIEDNLTKQATKNLERIRKEIEKAVKGEATTPESYLGKLIGGIFNFKCPVSVAVYDSTGSQEGYVGDDDLWYNDSIYIEKNGDVKTVYTNGAVSFKITGTDYGTLNCTYEEYENGAATRRINYYGIPIETGKELTANISEDGNTIVLRETGGQTLSEDETISAGDYSKSAVRISAKANGGSVQGTGKFVRGDSVQLMAFPDDGYNFIGWQDNNGALIEISTLYEFTAKEDATLTAVFAKALDSVPTTSPTPTPTSSPTPIATPTPTPKPTSNPTPTPNSKHPFIDVKGNAWYAQAVQYVYENGLMAGVSSTTFSPNSTTTRGQLVTILYRAEGAPVVEETNRFSDVQTGKWYSKAVAWASEKGIVSGYGNGRFGPNDSVTREQMVTILRRYAESRQIDTNKKADLSNYTDYKTISTYAVTPMQWAVAEGLISGTSKTTLSPKATSTRAQIAAVLKRYREKFGDSTNQANK